MKVILKLTVSAVVFAIFCTSWEQTENIGISSEDIDYAAGAASAVSMDVLILFLLCKVATIRN